MTAPIEVNLQLVGSVKFQDHVAAQVHSVFVDFIEHFLRDVCARVNR